MRSTYEDLSFDGARYNCSFLHRWSNGSKAHNCVGNLLAEYLAAVFCMRLSLMTVRQKGRQSSCVATQMKRPWDADYGGGARRSSQESSKQKDTTSVTLLSSENTFGAINCPQTGEDIFSDSRRAESVAPSLYLQGVDLNRLVYLRRHLINQWSWLLMITAHSRRV